MLESRPNIDHLNEIHDWLKAEWIENQEGFYCNWQKIKEAFEDGELLIYEVNKVAVGFIVFTEIDSTWIIDIAEIRPTARNKGIGTQFVHEAISYFKSKEAKMLKIYCSTQTADSFWKKMGFQNCNASLIELGTPLALTINANLNVNPSLTSVTFP